jgi:signal transduction histidine kinase
MLDNYLSTALNFTGDDGTITVRFFPGAESLHRIEVKDNGIGIAAPCLCREFERFCTNEELREWNGLGRAIIKGTLESQNSWVGVNSTFGLGSRFYAVLPRGPRP